MGKPIKLSLKLVAQFMCKVNLPLCAEMTSVGVHQQLSKGSLQCGLFSHILSSTKMKFHFRLISAAVFHLDNMGKISSV